METGWEGMRNIRTRPHVLEQIFSGEPVGVAAIDLNRHAGCLSVNGGSVNHRYLARLDCLAFGDRIIRGARRHITLRQGRSGFPAAFYKGQSGRALPHSKTFGDSCAVFYKHGVSTGRSNKVEAAASSRFLQGTSGRDAASTLSTLIAPPEFYTWGEARPHRARRKRRAVARQPKP